jgi:hypothetical protein
MKLSARNQLPGDRATHDTRDHRDIARLTVTASITNEAVEEFG